MREPLSSNGRKARQIGPRGLLSVRICLLLLTCIALLWVDAVAAQNAPSANRPTFGVGMSPTGSQSAPQAGIPLGSSEIATPGIAPVDPMQSAGTGTCSGTGNARSSGALFDGGGLSGSTSLSCADARNPAISTPFSPSAGRAGTPLGATELGNAGVSPLLPVPDPNQSGNVSVAPLGSTQPSTNAGLPGAGP
jgi:hypothetical protein